MSLPDNDTENFVSAREGLSQHYKSIESTKPAMPLPDSHKSPTSLVSIQSKRSGNAKAIKPKSSGTDDDQFGINDDDISNEEAASTPRSINSSVNQRLMTEVQGLKTSNRTAKEMNEIYLQKGIAKGARKDIQTFKL